MSSFWIYTPRPLTSACNFLASCAPLNVIPLYPAPEISYLKFLKILAKLNSPQTVTSFCKPPTTFHVRKLFGASMNGFTSVDPF